MKKIVSKKNPIIPLRGVCDPHIHVFEGKLWLYASHDTSFENKDFDMRDWQIWSTEDCVNWTLESVVRPEETFVGSTNSCWAVDCAYRNGKYYYYFSIGNTGTGVLVGDTPAGPFVDVLGKPLLDGTLTTTREYDPTVFCDDDGEYYLIFGAPSWYYGEGCGYYIARLNEDMISLAEAPRPIELNHIGDDKASMNKFNGRYYLSYGGFYAVSDCIYGPYNFVGHTAASIDHTSFCEWNNQLFHAITVDESSVYFRSSGLCYAHIRTNGEIVTDPLIVEYGVGQYDSNWNRIEAEWYMKAENVCKKENDGMPGFSIVCDKQAELYYPNIRNLEDKFAVEFTGTFNGGGGTIELRESTKNGPLLGTARVDKPSMHTYSWNSKIRCPVRFEKKLPTKLDLCVLLIPDQGATITVDYFNFWNLPSELDQ